MLNRHERTFSFYDEAAGRWAFEAGSEVILVKATCLEPIGPRAKMTFGFAFQRAAFKYQRRGPVAADHLFQLLCDLPAQKGQPGVAAFLLPLFDDRAAFDDMYGKMAAMSPDIVYQ